MGMAAPQEMSISMDGGGIGQTFTINLEGPPNGSYYLLMSLTTGPTVTPWCTLDVGFDLLTFCATIPGFVDYFEADGTKELALFAPNDPLLDGLNLNFQNCLLNNMATPILDISNLYRVTFAYPNSFAYTLETMPDRIAGAATAGLPDGTVIMAGGTVVTGAGTYVTAGVLLYEPGLERFAAAPYSLPAPRTGMTATVLDDGRVLFLGGMNGSNDPTTTSWVFDPATSSFSIAGAMSLTRIMYQPVLLEDGRVLVIGGYTDPTDETSMINTMQKTTEIFDPATSSFGSGPNMAKPRVAFTATRLGNAKVIVAGGVSYFELFGIKIPELLDKAELYTPNTGIGSFGSPISMTRTRTAHSAHLLPSGKVLIVSGATGTFIDYDLTTTCSLVDSSGQTFSSTGDMTTSRIGCQMLTRDNGTVIAMAGGAGDLNNPMILGSSEIYNLSSGTWSAGPSLNMTRFAFGFAPLPDGTWLLAGGFSGNPASVSDTAEIYQP